MVIVLLFFNLSLQTVVAVGDCEVVFGLLLSLNLKLKLKDVVAAGDSLVVVALLFC